MPVFIITCVLICSFVTPRSYGYQNEFDDKSDVMQEILGWNFSNLNPDAVIFGNAIRVMEGPSGHSLKFDGKNDFVRVTSSIGGQVHDLTVSAWVKPDYSLTSKQFTILDKPESFSLYLKSEGTEHHAVFSVYTGAKWYSIESKKSIDAKWTKLLGVFNGRFIGIYVNDTIDSYELVQAPTFSDLFPIVFTDISSSDLLIGASTNGSSASDFFSGQIDEVQVFPSDGYLLNVVEDQSNLTNSTDIIPQNMTTNYTNIISQNMTINSTNIISQNMTIHTNSTNTNQNMTITNSTTIPQNMTTQTNFTNTNQNMTITNSTNIIPQNMTTQTNVTEVPSGMPIPLHHYSFNLNSILPNMIKNATIVSDGITGTALQLSTGGYVSEKIPETDQLSNLSLSAWINPDYTTGAKTLTILNKANSFLLQIQNISADQGTASFSIFDGVSWHTIESKSKIPVGWTHLAATFNGSQISIYVNGVLDTVQPVSKIGISESGQIQSGDIKNLNSNSDILIGAQLRENGINNPFNGLIDELSIYNVYLDDTQINNIFEQIVKSTGYTPVTVVPIIIPENITNVPIPIPTAELNFSLNLQNKSKTFGDVSISPSGVNGSSLKLSGHGFVSQSINSTNQISSLTVSAWVKPDYQKGSSEYTVLGKQKSFLLTIHNNISPKKIASFSIFDGISWHTVESQSKIQEKWTHLAAMFNGTSISIYVNGIKEGNQSVSSLGISISGQLETKTTQNLTSNSDVLIGAQKASTRDQTSFQSMFGGNIDEVHIYKSALSPSEIYKEYLQGADAIKKTQDSQAVNAAIPQNSTTLANSTNLVLQNSTLPITLSVKKHKASYLTTDHPEFDFEFISSDVLKKQGKSIKESIGEQQTGKWTDKNGTINVDVIDPNGKKVPIPINFIKLRDGKFDIKLGSARAGKAGAYTMRITLAESGKIYTTESTYNWGLVSLNTEKSIYRPGELSNFTIVVLDNAGHSVCDSNIVMNIKDPASIITSLSTGNGITTNEECGLYDASYFIPTSGNYTVDVTATNPSGIANFTTSFLVANSFPFEITRSAASKIDPTTNPNSFNVKIDTTSFVNQNRITIKESVSSIFNVTTDANVQTVGDTKILTWNKDLISNKTSVQYSYSVPPVFPQLYALGPVEIDYGNQKFTEARNWFVAVDPGGHTITFTAPRITADSSILSSTVVVDFCTGTCTPTLAGGTGQTKVTKSQLGSGLGSINSGTAVHFIWVTNPTISETWIKSTCSATTCTNANPTTFSMPNAAETVTANYQTTNTLQDSLGISDTVSISRSIIQSLQDLLTTSDVVSTTASKTKSLSDSISITYSIITSTTRTKLLTDSLSLSDSITMSASKTKSLSDSMSMADSLVTSATKIKSSVDSLAVSDALSISASKTKSLSDSISINDSLDTSTIKTKSLADSLSVSDALDTSSIKTKSLSDSVSMADSLAVSASKIKSLSDALSIIDLITQSASKTKSLLDSVSISDSFATSSIKTKSLLDSLAVSDALSTSSIKTKSLSDSISISDSITQSASKTKSFVDSLAVSDSITQSATKIKSLSDSMLMTDSLATAASKVRSLSDSLSATDSLTTSASKIKSLSDSIFMTDTIAQSASKTRSLSDALSATDSLDTSAIKTKSLVDSLSMADSLATSSTKIKSLSDSLDVSDVLSTSASKTKSLVDSTPITDSIVTLASKTKSLSDSMPMTDSITQSTTKSLSDSLAVSDSLVTSAIKIKSLDDSVSIMDLITQSATKIKSLSDSMSITDSLSNQASLQKSLSDSLDMLDNMTASHSVPNFLSEALEVKDSVTTLKIKSDQYVVPDNQTTVNVDPNKPNLVITNNNTMLSSITIPSTVTSSTLNYAAIVSSGTVHVTHALNITKDTNGDGKIEVILTIPAVTDISNSAWDGILQLPTIQTSSSLILPAPQGQVGTAKTVIDIGSSLSLTLSNATRLSFVGQTGSHVGFFHSPASVTEVTQTCTSDDQSAADTLPIDGICKISVGQNLIVWTKHFTGFATWTLGSIPQTPTAPQIPTGSGSGGYGTGSVTVTTGITSATAMLPTGVTLYDVTYDICDKQNVQFTVGSPDTTTPTVEFATTSGVVTAQISDNQPYAGLHKLVQQHVLSYDATLKPDTKTFNLLVTPRNGTGYITATVDVTQCKQTVTFAPIPIIGTSSPDAPKIFDVRLQTGNGTRLSAAETDNQYITDQKVTVSGLVYSLVPLDHAEVRTGKIGGNSSISYFSTNATIIPTSISHTYLVSATIPQEYIVSPAMTYWIHAKNIEGFETESETYSIGVLPSYDVSGTIGFVMPQNVPAGLTQSPQVYLTNNAKGVLYGTVSLVVDGKQVSQFVDHVFDRGTSVMELDWNVPNTDNTTVHSVQAITTFYGHTISSGKAEINSYVHKKIIPLENMASLESFVDKQGNVIASPRSLYSSFVTSNSTSLHVVSPGGVCVIGDSTSCLVNESTVSMHGRYSSVKVDGVNYIVYYSGSNSTLQRFTITSLQPITGDWQVTLEKNGTEQKDLEHTVHVNIRYVAENKQLLTSLP